MVGHFPVGGWAGIALSWLKRQANETLWDAPIGSWLESICGIVCDRLSEFDPVGGVWNVSKCDSGVLWCDASSIALGVVLQIDNVTVEDGCWLRTMNDEYHINNAELEGIVFSNEMECGEIGN